MARHLVAAGGLLDDEPELALEHARAARDRASRIAAVREAVGVAAYHAGDYAEAARELRAYARMSGDDSYRAVLADCERALGRPENALRLVQDALSSEPGEEELVELRLVESGARQDLGETAAAALVLEAALGGRPTPAALGNPDLGQLRLATAYAELLDARGEEELAGDWFAAIAAADPDDLTGVAALFADEDDEDDATGDPAVDGPAADDRVVEEQVAQEEAVAQQDGAADPADGDHPGAEDAAQLPTAEIGGVEFADVDFGDVSADDIEAEVAELLGETPPPVERDHTRLFQEAPGHDAPEQEPPTD
ncbi:MULTISPECIES: tetratricopeptide repeat protein [unclassified Modestobacter]|uniref:tetratricopeptide repeat protein n=1 Tax=unclassified Modestobacter TaxID=2643866 RepID=UPI0022AA3A10|nr:MULTISPECIES: hypothetical protein [unclassified Modestobacter]MCZ2825809.1 hypothetical protein [Modestobacter sp. VKM Ac-2981]MCZ2853126.1 hypothetical protein [Modestobacter sp. VKM Ac-2982]